MGSPARSPNQLIAGLEDASGLPAPGLVACPKYYRWTGAEGKCLTRDFLGLESKRRQEQENPESSGGEGTDQ